MAERVSAKKGSDVIAISSSRLTHLQATKLVVLEFSNAPFPILSWLMPLCRRQNWLDESIRNSQNGAAGPTPQCLGVRTTPSRGGTEVRGDVSNVLNEV